jgi:predicted DCC family thiol-disulfide oxidoreductase YuxK
VGPVGRLTVLYDAECGLCRWVRGWLEGSALLVPLDWVPCGSDEARRRLPHLDHDRTRDEVTVVADTGEVWSAEGAWILCLWATAAHRDLAVRLGSSAAGRRMARAAALSVAATVQGRPAPPACAPAAPTGRPVASGP